MLIKNLLVLSLFLGTSSYTNFAIADEASVIAEREAQQAAEAAKQVAQNAAIQAERERISAENAARDAQRVLSQAEYVQTLATSWENIARQEGADTSIIEQNVSKLEAASKKIEYLKEYSTLKNEIAQSSAQLALIAAQEAAVAAQTAQSIGLINWINMADEAANKATQDANLAQTAADVAQQAVNGVALAAQATASSLKFAEKALSAATYTGTDVADWDWSVWDTEGFDPVVNNTMLFDALAAQYTTPNGNGWRHELKIKSSERVAMSSVYEDFSANVRLDLSTGSKTIIAQHHASDTGTIMKLYVSDSSESGFFNSVANDGIFDVYVRLLSNDGYGEQKLALGTVESGDNFDFQVINDHGFVTVSAMGESLSLEIQDSPASYLKFGNYLQAQDAETLDKVESSDDFAQFYADAGIVESEVTFTNLNYVREVDAPVVGNDPEGQSVAITDTATDSAGKIRINLDSALPTGKVTVNVKYTAQEIETAYLTLFGASTSSSNAVADLKMDSGYAAQGGNVGIKLRSTDSWIADYPADEWSHITVAWDSVDTYKFTVSINGAEIGTYDMNFIDNVEHIELKIGSNSKVTDHTFYVDDINVYADVAATDLVFSENFEQFIVGTDLSGYDANYSSSTNSAVITDVANANGYKGPVVEDENAPSQSVAITDVATDSAGKLRVRLGEALPTGKVSVKVKYNALESETAYLTLFGSSTSTSNAVADLKMDSGYGAADGNVGIKLRSTDNWIADYSADEWAEITVTWDNLVTNQFTVSINGLEVGTYAMYNNIDVEKIDIKLGSNSNTTDYTLYVDDLAVYRDQEGSDLVFADDFEAIEVDTNLTGFGDYYDAYTNSAVVNNVENATVIVEDVIEYSQSVAITDTAIDSAGKLRLSLDEALPTGKVSVKVKYNALETETAYLTLFGASTSTSNAIADLKMDTGYSQTAGNVGIKLRSTDTWIADFAADEWATITVSWDNVITNTFTVTINDVEIGTYAMYNNFDVEKLEVKLSSNSKTTDYTLYLDDLAVYADEAGSDLVFFDDFEAIDVDTDLSGFGDYYDSNSNSAVVNNVENGTTSGAIIDEPAPSQWVAITDTLTDSSGKLRVSLDNIMPEGQLSIKVKYSSLESETAYITLFGDSTSTSNAVADLKLDSGYAAADGNVGIKLRSTDAWIADFAADEWATINVAWDNVTTNQITVSVNDVTIGSFAMFNNFDVETIDIKLSSSSNTTDYIFFVDDLNIYSDTAATSLVFSDDFESTPLDTNLSGYGNNYSSSSVSAIVSDQISAMIEVPVIDDDKVFVDVNPDLVPADNFDLSQWYVSVPTDEDFNGKSDSIKEDALNAGYESDEYFYSAVDGGMVFMCYVDGYKTSTNTSYTRTELREMIRAGDTSIDTQGVNGNNWVFSSAPAYQHELAGGVDGNMKATLAVNHVTSTGETYQQGRVIVGQIHAASDEPIRLYYRLLPGHTKGSIYFAHEPSNGNAEQWYEMIGSRSDSAAEPADGIELDEVFGYEIDVQGNLMTVSIFRNGKDTITEVVDMSDSGYDGFYEKDGVETEDYMYFKAGVYNQNNSGDSTDYVQATFYSLEQTHN